MRKSPRNKEIKKQKSRLNLIKCVAIGSGSACIMRVKIEERVINLKNGKNGFKIY